jgi:hypothetical protein
MRYIRKRPIGIKTVDNYMYVHRFLLLRMYATVSLDRLTVLFCSYAVP